MLSMAWYTLVSIILNNHRYQRLKTDLAASGIHVSQEVTEGLIDSLGWRLRGISEAGLGAVVLSLDTSSPVSEMPAT